MEAVVGIIDMAGVSFSNDFLFPAKTEVQRSVFRATATGCFQILLLCFAVISTIMCHLAEMATLPNPPNTDRVCFGKESTLGHVSNSGSCT